MVGNVADDGFGIRIEEEFAGVAAVAKPGVVGAGDAVAIELAGGDAGEVGVPDVVRSLSEREAFGFGGVVGVIEEAELDRGSSFGEESEVGAPAIVGGAEGSGLSGPGHVLVLSPES